MKTLRLRSVELGCGRPKVCVPLVAVSVAALAGAMTALTPGDFDLVELRADFLVGSAEDQSMVGEAISVVRDALPGEVPILFTYRTTREGGEQETTPHGYVAVLETALASGQVDAIDVEMVTPRTELEQIQARARSADVPIVMSNHEFGCTPPKDELVSRLRTQQDLGADLVKIAVMPSTARDVLTLLDATDEFVTRYAEVPVITMAMGSLGAISRISGETFGSCLSFGSVGRASAPGQLEAAQLTRILEMLHQGVTGPT